MVYVTPVCQISGILKLIMAILNFMELKFVTPWNRTFCFTDMVQLSGIDYQISGVLKLLMADSLQFGIFKGISPTETAHFVI